MWDWVCSSVTEHLPSMPRTLGSLSSTKGLKKETNKMCNMHLMPGCVPQFLHPNTNQARSCLVSEIKRDWYGYRPRVSKNGSLHQFSQCLRKDYNHTHFTGVGWWGEDVGGGGGTEAQILTFQGCTTNYCWSCCTKHVLID
jgi:hypothetical protein